MDNKDEYQDPDYHVSSAGKKTPSQDVSEEDKLEKIKKIIRREFSNELEAREKEVILIDQRMTSSRRLLHKLRYALVNNYFRQERLQLSSGHIQDDVEAMSQVQANSGLANLLCEGQKRIHPSVRKLLGKDTVDLSEIFKSREPRNKTRKDYYAMIKAKNVTTPADATKTLRPVKKSEPADVEMPPLEPTEPKEPVQPKKIPRHLDPKILNVYTIDEATRNKTKQRYRIIIGNTSKYAPPASRADRSTHKWLLYIRGAKHQPDLSRVLTAATVRLHHSYAPHHTVRLHKPPFHVSRRGWGEFPAKIELHFALPSRNRPATVEHTIKLDRNYTGLQTLGAETIVDVWLFSTPEMLEYEYKEPLNDDIKVEPQDTGTNTQQTQPDSQATRDTGTSEVDMPIPIIFNKIKEEPETTHNMEHMDDAQNNWMEFFSKNTTEVNVDEMLVKTNTDSDENSILRNVLLSNRNDVCLSEAEVISPDIDKDTDAIVSDDDNILRVPMGIMNQPKLEKKRIVKYIEPNTGKIYYLEMDRKLDLSKVQEIIIESENGAQTAKISPMKSNGLRNVRKHKKMVSLLKPECKSTENRVERVRNNFNHIENDHCYFSTNREPVGCTEHMQEDYDSESESDSRSDDEELTVLQSIQQDVLKLSNVRTVVDYSLKKIPIICALARNPNYVKCFPFVVESEERYWKLDFAKRRNIEWSRAKLINKILLDKFGASENVWRTKQILIYSRLHGYYPVRTDSLHRQTESNLEEWSSWNDLDNSRKIETNIKEIYSNAAEISTLSVFDSKQFTEDSVACVDMVDSEEEIDVVETKCEVKTVLPVTKDVTNLRVLPVDSDEDRLRFLYIERKCADIGIELRNEDVGNGCSYSAVHAVLLSAMKSFAEELIRSSLASELDQRRHLDGLPSVWVGSSSGCAVRLEHALAAVRRNARLHALTARALAAERRDTAAPL